MRIIVNRKWKKPEYTIGKLEAFDQAGNIVFSCNTMEDKDRGLTQMMPLSKIKEVKVAAMTAIPSGTYVVNMNTISPKYSLKPWYFKNCHGGRVPRLENVPGYSGVLIHTGNTAKDTAGCLLVGKNDVVGMITQSKPTFLKLYDLMYKAYKKGETIKITIK